MNSKLQVLPVLLLALALLFGCTSQAGNGNIAAPAELVAGDGNSLAAQGTAGSAQQYSVTFKVVSGSETLFLKSALFPAGTNAFDAMKQMFEVEYKEYAFGAMVTSINGISAGEGEYWALYSDGNYAMQGISSYVLDKDASFEWRLEEISQAQV
ncbi:MAG: DUF4430 domain-containing protein [Candidatus Diapherotrites archaeon]